MTDFSKNIFCAINTTDLGEATTLAAQVSEFVGGIMLGMEYFCANGHKGIKQIKKASDRPLYLDLKLHNIPSTAARAVKAVLPTEPQFITLHAGAGGEMLKAAMNAAREADLLSMAVPVPKLIGTTVLTSIDEETFRKTNEGTIDDRVKRLAETVVEAGLDGIECSGKEVAALREFVGKDMLIVVPGIRPVWSEEIIDQKRICSPFKAIKDGADILIIGRPITSAPDPLLAAKRIATEIINTSPDEEKEALEKQENDVES